MSTVLQLYDSCGIVTHLLQVIQTLPPSLLELPLALLSRLLLCDPERSLSRFRETASGFFSPPSDGQLTGSTPHTPLTRSASCLLAALLQQDVLWDSAVELLNILAQIARRAPSFVCFQPLVEAPVLHQALSHCYDLIRAASCRLLGSLDPFRPPSLFSEQLNTFKAIIDCLHDSYMPVRRMACRAVGNWLGYIAAGFKVGRADGKCSDTTEREQIENNLPAAVRLRVDVEEARRWTEEARRSVAPLAALISDSDVLTRRHCCAAQGNLMNIEGTVGLLLEEDVSSLLLRAACTDPDNSVRQAATATLCLYTQQDALRQVILSLDAKKKLLRASQNASSHCDYQQLIGQL